MAYDKHEKMENVKHQQKLKQKYILLNHKVATTNHVFGGQNWARKWYL
jgi:hypothetical protein